MKHAHTVTQNNQSREERISSLAYRLWEEDGRPEGQSESHWLKACQAIDAETSKAEEVPAWLKPDNKPPVHDLRKRAAA